MKKLALVFVVLLASLQVTYACSCIPLGPLTIKDFNETSVIFIGKVKTIKNISDRDLDHNIEVVFEVSELFKGAQIKKEVTLQTASSSAACGIYFKKNENWIIYANHYNKILTTGACSRSRYVSSFKKEDLALLRSFSNQKNKRAFLIKGVKRGEGLLKNNIPEGKWKYFSASGALLEEGSYINGEKDGQWVTYIDTALVEKNLKINGVIAKNATIIKDNYSNKPSLITNYNKGQLHGEYINYYEGTFRPSRLMNYVNGEQNGIYIDYYPTGLIHTARDYDSKRKESFSRAYYENGQLIFEGKYVDGVSTGFKLYDEDGKLIVTSKNEPYYEPMDKKYVLNN